MSERELEVLTLWTKLGYQVQDKQDEEKPNYVVLDEPHTIEHPFDNIIGSFVNDTMARYYQQRGYNVHTAFGWNYHGVLTERGIRSRMGYLMGRESTDPHKEEFKQSFKELTTHSEELWKITLARLGRHVDWEKTYSVTEISYKESVWWAFKTLWNKGCVYEEEKVQLYFPYGNTIVEEFECTSEQSHREDICVLFQTAIEPNAYFVVCTGKPWTLTGNLALCVNPELVYVKVEDQKTKRHFILLESRLRFIYPRSRKITTPPYRVLESFIGATLKGTAYRPLFPCYQKYPNAFEVHLATFVSDEFGSGVIHLAPAFDPKAYELLLSAGIITRHQVPCPINDQGVFFEFIPEEVNGREATRMCNIIPTENILQSCASRCSTKVYANTELIRLPKTSWFLRVEANHHIIFQIIDQISWLPELKLRFETWLGNSKDWAISRQNYWGLPIPIWTNPDRSELLVIGSLEELTQLSGVSVKDFTREQLDNLQIPSPTGGVPLKRINEVFDSWFESGCMSFARYHYPFENKYQFLSKFPIDCFIACNKHSSIYPPIVVSALLFNQSPFKKLVTCGNFRVKPSYRYPRQIPIPTEIFDHYGSDTFRLHTFYSPVICGDSQIYSIENSYGQRLQSWLSTQQYAMNQLAKMEEQTGEKFKFLEDLAVNSSYFLDKWILLELKDYADAISETIEHSPQLNILPILKFIDNLNTYLPLYRTQVKIRAEIACIHTFCYVLLHFATLVAPFVPFTAEIAYQQIRSRFLPSNSLPSVHMMQAPTLTYQIDEYCIKDTMAIYSALVSNSQKIRSRRTIHPTLALPQAIIVVQVKDIRDILQSMEAILKDSLAVKSVLILEQYPEEQAVYQIKPIFQRLGKRFSKETNSIAEAIRKLEQHQIVELLNTNSLIVNNQEITTYDVTITTTLNGDPNTHETCVFFATGLEVQLTLNFDINK